ncbi:MAG TPA: lipoyl(octanoyl) transferase LipB [Gemmataceae bacterium]|nr:lipoyl(octanoyl) transferase LipB [Gemmataceae bacterium]
MSLHPPSLTAADPALQAYLLGTVSFDAALGLQRMLVYQTSGDRDGGSLLLCEHPPMISVGRHGSRAHVLYEPEDLQHRGWRVRWVNRGGGCVLHLPGQVAVYPVLALDRHRLGVQAYLGRLQQVVLAVLDDFSIRGATDSGRPGVWVNGRLIASIGVAVRDWVAYYGLYFNVNPDLHPFRHVRCDLQSREPMTSLVRERRGPLRTSMVRERFVEHFAARFGFARTSLFFHHPALARRAPLDAVAANS